VNDKRIEGLDGLRGIAILLVLLFHYFPEWKTGLFGRFCSLGWTGVDLFFVLSGFLITGILFDTQHSEGFYRNFYVRRILRLVPAYVVFVCVVLLLAHGFGQHRWQTATAYLLYGSNIVAIFDPNFRFIGPTEVAHVWSLALEEQFYFVWPWLIALLVTRGRIFKACIFGSIAALGLRLLLAHAPLPPTTLYLELPTRADALLIGAGIAMLVREPRFNIRANLWPIRATGLVAAIAFLIMGHRAHSFSFDNLPIKTWGFSLTAIAAGAALLLSMTEGTWTNRFCSLSVLRFYGRYSYGIYLIHYAPHLFYSSVLARIEAHIPQIWLAGTIAFFGMLAVVTPAAMLSFHLVEKPFLRLKTKFQYGVSHHARLRAPELASEAAEP
jgi:peptidoglycan/LPS O-acetylase OafA/YrhL